MKSMYIIGSLRNEEIPEIAKSLRDLGFDAFDDWYAAGPIADDCWKSYEEQRGNTYKDALKGYAAKHVFEFDKYHLNRCDSALLVLPAGKSGHLELGYMAGLGKETYVLLDHPDRWDIMYQFATKVFENREDMERYFKENSDMQMVYDLMELPMELEISPQALRGIYDDIGRYSING